MGRRFSLIGPGRAGRSIQAALVAQGWDCAATIGRGDNVAAAIDDVELCIIATPDAAIESVAASLPASDAVVMHLSGATPLVVLEPHRAAALHPLTSLADPTAGAAALGDAWFAVAGDPIASEIADMLSGRWFAVEDEDRALYHCAAAVASNHVTAMLGQVERMAREVGVPFEAFMPLIQASLDNTAAMGATDALTGPVARGDESTIEQHRRALAERLPDELAGYDAGVDLARRLRP